MPKHRPWQPPSEESVRVRIGGKGGTFSKQRVIDLSKPQESRHRNKYAEFSSTTQRDRK